MKDNDGYNDRCILILLEHKEFKTKKEKRLLNKLKDSYPDHNNVMHQSIKDDLFKRQFLKNIDLRPDLPNYSETGATIDYEKKGITKYKAVTTKSGETALKNKLFTSELAEKTRKETLLSLDRWVKWIAVIGGIAGLINFTPKVIKFIGNIINFTR